MALAISKGAANSLPGERLPGGTMTAMIHPPDRGIREVWRNKAPRLSLRGPEPDIARPFAAVLGGSETCAADVSAPYPQLLSEWTGVPVVNMGVMHAGLSLYASERWLIDVAARAEVTIVQVTGAQNMSNRLFCVHPRRNDRFLTGSQALSAMYPGVDFTEVHFTGHLMSVLRKESPTHFETLAGELRWAWVQRLRRLLQSIPGNVLLLWLSERRPEDDDLEAGEPMFVTRAMLDEVSPLVSSIIEVVRARPKAAATAIPFACHPQDAAIHAAAAEALAPLISALMKKGPGLSTEAPTSHVSPDQSFSRSSGTAVNKSATRP